MRWWWGFDAVGFCVSSALLLVVNKLCLEHLHLPALLSVVQFASTAVVARIVLWRKGEPLPPLQWLWLQYTIVFSLSVYMNLRLLVRIGVASIIVVRACAPLSVCWLEYACLDRQLPDLQRICIVLSIGLSAMAYNCDRLHTVGMSEVLETVIYFVSISWEMIVAKKVSQNAEAWVATYYNNTSATLLMSFMAVFSGEFVRAVAAAPLLSMRAVALVAFSCMLGTSISVYSWKTRGHISASAFTVLGIGNKFVSIWITSVIWPNALVHAQHLIVATCILCSASYRSMPERETCVAEESAPLKA